MRNWEEIPSKEITKYSGSSSNRGHLYSKKILAQFEIGLFEFILEHEHTVFSSLRPGGRVLLVNLFWPVDIISEEGLISETIEHLQKQYFISEHAGIINETVLISARVWLTKIRYAKNHTISRKSH